ncbi:MULTISPECIES: pseudouridine synthase [unclassified Sporosarcina]|uniref:pseudouridine synthase n=1 Tax=unclassified Sporosarcina TaxID=2647733 RepID=UPI000C16CCA2|nr:MULTISPECIES: pseudouridine synthase [unclassified Sporosarcina]PIC98446.1 23S rRNA pseudouridine synthase F [Sporosarcina sp. P29]PID04949.1 23S rRNA pseudouridine synthase F [Sporosarcina sp. P30]PID08208.1 23S rRNA pseudouridine synthase F [Sporosarcina sp. P31]PID11288.1 23S rRNA pseudouridine synthase F [Sporosarcina sp. P32b]
MRINKFLSGAGIVSRRGADQWIADGRVKINGQLAELGSKVEVDDQVEVDGKLVEQEEQLVYIALNKPVGITSTTERHIEGNVIDFVNHPLRIFHIGRLDKDSDGLLLLTNDGDIVNEILREEYGHEKEYIVTVDSPLTASFISQMENGVKILDTVTKPCTVKKLGPKTFSIILTQGLNRQIRRMCAALGYHIRRLQRVRILTIELGDLPIGEWRELTDAERNKLFKTLHYEPKR